MEKTKHNYSVVGSWIFGVTVLFGLIIEKSYDVEIAFKLICIAGVVYSVLSLIGLSKNQAINFFFSAISYKAESAALKKYYSVCLYFFIILFLTGLAR